MQGRDLRPPPQDQSCNRGWKWCHINTAEVTEASLSSPVSLPTAPQFLQPASSHRSAHTYLQRLVRVRHHPGTLRYAEVVGKWLAVVTDYSVCRIHTSIPRTGNSRSDGCVCSCCWFWFYFNLHHSYSSVLPSPPPSPPSLPPYCPPPPPVDHGIRSRKNIPAVCCLWRIIKQWRWNEQQELLQAVQRLWHHGWQDGHLHWCGHRFQQSQVRDQRQERGGE